MEYELATKLRTGKANDVETDVLIVTAYRKDEDEIYIDGDFELPESQLDAYEAKKSSTEFFYDGDFPTQRLLVVGCGDLDDLDVNDLLKLSGQALQTVRATELESASLIFPDYLEFDRTDSALRLTLGFLLGSYKFDEYQSDESDEETTDGDEPDDKIESFDLLLEDRRSLSTVRRGYERAKQLGDAIFSARNLANKPSNDLTPERLSEYVKTMESDDNKLSTEIFNEQELRDNDMNLLLGVGKGSSNPPRLIKAVYEPDDPKGTIALAGKGVTFDSGGISIKPSKGMDEMKFDMCGAATVAGVIKAVQALELPVKVIAMIPTVENMPGQNALKPGDIVTGYYDKSVEVLNTDAEGRLILADALGYLSQNHGGEIDCLMDFATLTGACITALGHEAAALMSNNDELAERLMEISQTVNEPVWQLPLWDQHSEQMESEVADVKNIGGDAGAITAGAFLREFVDEEKIQEWAHFDIAGTGWGMQELTYRPKGGTGFGVWLTIEFIKDYFSVT